MQGEVDRWDSSLWHIVFFWSDGDVTETEWERERWRQGWWTSKIVRTEPKLPESNRGPGYTEWMPLQTVPQHPLVALHV